MKGKTPLTGFWNPDRKTERALARGVSKLRKAESEGRIVGADKPHHEGIIPAEGETTMAVTKKATSKKGRTTRRATAKAASNKRSTRAKGGRPAGGSNAPDPNKIPLKRICQKLEIDPKAARVKLRRNLDQLGFHGRATRWEFTKVQAAKAEAILTGQTD